MAEFLPPVILEIQANATKAIAQMQMVNGELDKMEVKALKAGGSIDVMTKASKYAGTALLGIAGVLGTVGAVSIKAALGVQESQAKLQIAVKNTGVSFAAFVPYMNNAQDAMVKFGFSASDTNEALAMMTAATQNPATAVANLGVVADLAAFKNESLATAADTVSRAAMGQARGLADLGLAIGKTIPKGADLATITKMIEDRVKGAAAAAAKADPWKVLTTQFGALEEKLGTALLPAFKKLSDWIINTGLPALEKIGKWISQNQGLFESIATALGILWVAPKIDGLLTAIGKIATAWRGVETAAEAASAAEVVAETGGTALPALAVGALAYSQRNTPKKVANAIKSLGLSASSGGMLGGISTSSATGGSTVTLTAPAGSIKPSIGDMNPSTIATIAASNKELINQYLKAGWKITSGSSSGGIDSKKSPLLISSTKSTKPKAPSLAQQKAGMMGGGGALTLTITTDSGAVVKSITGSAGNTKVVVKK